MNGIHDLGGRHGMGPIDIDPGQPIFRADWERRMFGMFILAFAGGHFNIDQFRAAGRKVCELTRLALAESADSKAVLASLFSLAHAVGRTMHDVTDVFIEVNPRHVSFYSRVLGFAVAAGERFCERARAPSVLLQLEIEALEKRLHLLEVAALMQPLAKAA